MSERTAVYRMFSAAGILLYIGVAKNFGVRWARHAAEKPWWPDVQRQTVEWYPDRDSALAAETAAIHAEKPLHNIVGMPRPLPVLELAPWDPEAHRYVGAAEIGRMLAVGRQRVYQLTAKPDFPEPFEILAAGKIWITDHVIAWATAHGRDVADPDGGASPRRDL